MHLPPIHNTAKPREAVGAPEFAIIEPLCAVFRRKLKSEGLKYTPERATILEAVITLGEAAGVFQAEKLIADLAARSFRVSKATVYRTLKLLAEAGIVQQVLFDSEQAHYQLAYGRGGSGLLVNMDTHQTIVLDLPELAAIRDAVCAKLGLVPEGHRLLVYARNPGVGAGRPVQVEAARAEANTGARR